MLYIGGMDKAYISTDPRAGTIGDQLHRVLQCGVDIAESDKHLDWGDVPYFHLHFSEGDRLGIAHPRAFGDLVETRLALDKIVAPITLHVAGHGVFALPDERPAFEALAAQRWKTPTPAQKRAPGRPPKHSQPSDTQREAICALWRSDASRDNVRAAAAETMGREVKDWEIKHWCGDSRAAR